MRAVVGPVDGISSPARATPFAGVACSRNVHIAANGRQWFPVGDSAIHFRRTAGRAHPARAVLAMACRGHASAARAVLAICAVTSRSKRSGFAPPAIGVLDLRPRWLPAGAIRRIGALRDDAFEVELDGLGSAIPRRLPASGPSASCGLPRAAAIKRPRTVALIQGKAEASGRGKILPESLCPTIYLLQAGD